MQKSLAKKGFQAQPRALYPLFLIEFWERFGFYAVQLILVLYLSNVFHLSDSDAFDLFGIASAFTYATPFIGGYLADKILGYRNSVLLGAVLLALGYGLLIIPGLSIFYWAMAFIVIGTGFFKSCISTLVGLLYKEEDPRRDGGFTIFYMGINLGAFFGPLMAGYVSVHIGWPFVFGFTGVGLVISFVTALLTFRLLGNKGLAPMTRPVHMLGLKMSPHILLFLGTLMVVGILGWLMIHHYLANILFRITCGICVLYLLVIAFRYHGIMRRHMIALIIMMICSAGFWAMFAQMFSSINLFTNRMVDRTLFNFTVPTPWFQALEGLFIVILTPFFVKLWNVVDCRQHWLKSGAAKFSLAFFFLALAFLVWDSSIVFAHQAAKVSMMWLALGYLFLTMGELCLSPIGLSIFSEFAPKEHRGMMMGAWMLSISAGYSLADALAKYSSVPDQVLKTLAFSRMGHYYSHAFLIFMWLALAMGIIVYTLVPLLNKMFGIEHNASR